MSTSKYSKKTQKFMRHFDVNKSVIRDAQFVHIMLYVCVMQCGVKCECK